MVSRLARLLGMIEEEAVVTSSLRHFISQSVWLSCSHALLFSQSHVLTVSQSHGPTLYSHALMALNTIL